METVSNKLGTALGASVDANIERNSMSLDVSSDLLVAAERGDVSDTDFVHCVRTSLPYAWDVVSTVMTQLRTGGDEFA
jgi:hypothetical protein